MTEILGRVFALGAVVVVGLIGVASTMHDEPYEPSRPLVELCVIDHITYRCHVDEDGKVFLSAGPGKDGMEEFVHLPMDEYLALLESKR